LMRLWW